jgi:hypothetical protein
VTDGQVGALIDRGVAALAEQTRREFAARDVLRKYL